MRGLAILVPLALLATVSVLQKPPADNHDGQDTAEVLGQQLTDQVEASDGTPRDGYDPASQPQASLAAAASSQTGTGSTVQPAAGVQGDHNHQVTAGDVYGDASSSGIGSSGCYIDYGVQGQQCLPAHAAEQGTLTCQGVRRYFAGGIKVTGNDRFQLDTNHDGTACNAADA